MENKAEAPCHVRGAFNPTELLTCEASCWVGVLKGLAPQLPVQLHCEPQELEQGKAMPIFANTIKVLENVREVDDLVEAARDHRARLKFRLSGRGKFIHRNRYPRRQAICTLHGAQPDPNDSRHGHGYRASASFSGPECTQFGICV